MDFRNDYYTILEVSTTGTKEEIRASYRRLAKKFHPDKNPGDASAEEKFKSINEAHEVLSNDILRREYDEYRDQQKKWAAEQKQQVDTASAASEKNKRTFVRTYTVTEEHRVYVRGEVTIKYWAQSEEEFLTADQTQWRYRITPYHARLKVTGTDIYPGRDIPTDYLKAFKESDLFRSPLTQPVKCKVVNGGEDEFYELPLYDIRIKNISLQGVTKHESQSFGTLTGELFAYTPNFSSYEAEETVTECFGETGAVETKVEGGSTYYRKEFYHPDCSKYWGEWYTLKKPSQAAPYAYKSSAVTPVAAQGCLQYWWIPMLILCVGIFPNFFIFLAAIALIWLLLSVISSVAVSFGRLLSGLLAAFFVYLFVVSIRSSAKGSSYVKHDTPSYDTLSTSREKLVVKSDEGNTTVTDDTLISHYIKWKDYDSIAYETTLSVALSDFRASATEHNNIEAYASQNPFASVYTSMLRENEKRMKYLYASLDSLKTANGLNDMNLANMIVSCVQAVPYYLVLDRECTDSYDDEFTTNYLATCNRDCCIGNEKFGVRSPAEFLADLKGDCDTRALFLYGILKHYNFNVALITSNYYQHAMIAVSFEKNPVDGFSMNIHNRNYYLWETTSAGLKAGQIPTYLRDLNHWDIALLNENQ